MNKSRIAVVAAATLMGAALLSGGAFAKGPGSGGGGGGGGPPTSPGASGKGDLYGDQWVIYRNEDGVPIVDDNGCVRPILYAPDYVNETCLIELVGDTDPDAGTLLLAIPTRRTSALHSPSLQRRYDACRIRRCSRRGRRGGSGGV